MSGEEKLPDGEIMNFTTKRPRSEANPSEQAVEEKTQREWLLQCPETFLGAMDPEVFEIPDFDCKPANAMRLTLSPALLHIVQEIIVNGLDNAFREGGQTYLKISFDEANGVLTTANDGPTPPMDKFEHNGRYKISGCFSNFQCGSNFDQNPHKKRHTSGRNGIGAAAANTFCEFMTVTVRNEASNRQFTQRWEQNMSVEHAPSIKTLSEKAKTTNETRVACKPDYGRFPRVESDEPQLWAILSKAVAHLAFCASLCAPSDVKVFWNGKVLSKLKTPEQFCVALGCTKPLASDTVEACDGSTQTSPNTIMEVCVATRDVPLADDVPGVTMGFVNSTPCAEGTHADYVISKVKDIIEAKARSKQRKGDDPAVVKPAFVRRHMIIVLKVRIDKPRFKSQTKAALNSGLKEWGWTWKPSDGFVESLERSPVVQRVVDHAKSKADVDASKAVKTSTRRVFKDAKYEPAQVLYKPDSTILITEGDSAKNFGVAGLSVVGRKKYGIYPVRGKFLNVRGMSAKKVSENEEARKLLQILGLSPVARENQGEALDKLPYGRLMILSDQDVDGAHIGALLMNLIHVCAPALLHKNPHFICRFATALIRVKLPGEADDRGFYSEVEYEAFRVDRVARGLSTGTVKYYKGLGTSDTQLAKRYFRELKQNTIIVRYTGDECGEAMDLAFNKTRAADRKVFLENRSANDSFVDYALEEVTMNRFVRDELLPAYATAAIERGIPALDGLNNARRKILWGAREVGMSKSTISVANAAGKISAKANYHHRGTAMEDAIIGMAGTFVGCSAGNLNLLVPDGQFGSRHNHEAASAAYPKTMLNSPLHTLLYPLEDNPVLQYVNDEGASVEPVLYAPVIAMPLCFGTDGIAVGWSTKCPCYDPRDLIAAAEAYIHGEPMPELIPFYRGFRGTVSPDQDGAFIVRGAAHYEGDDLHVTEVPPFRETDAYKEDWMKNEQLAPHGVVPGARFTDETVHLVLKKAQVMEDPVKGLGLEKKVTFSNVHLIGMDGKVKRYSHPHEIVIDHAQMRIDMYKRRLSHQLVQTEKELDMAQLRASFIQDCISGKFVMMAHEDDACASDALVALGYADRALHKDLLHMPANSVTRKRANELLQIAERKREQLDAMKAMTPEKAWLQDLDRLKVEVHKLFGDQVSSHKVS